MLRTVGDQVSLWEALLPDEVLRLQTVDWSKIAPVRGRIVEQFDRLFAA